VAGVVLKADPDPLRFGVAELNGDGRVVAFEEKPSRPKSNLIPIGVYLFSPSVFDVIHTLRPSARGEFEITDVLNHYLERGALISEVFEGEWQDAGTIESLLQANSFGGRIGPQLPLATSHTVEEVEAEPIDPREVRL
jgi:glucose-1-phosphate thymidylyltransferase